MIHLRALIAALAFTIGGGTSALAQCAGAGGINTIANCPAAVAVQYGDVLLGYQFAQTPHTRQVTIGQVLNTPGSAQYMPFSGGTLNGPLTLAQDPAGPMQAATKRYVDQQVQPSLTVSQTGSQGTPLSPLLSLTRINGQAADAPLSQMTYSANFADGPNAQYNIMALGTTITGDASGNGPAGDFYTFSSGLNINALRSAVAAPTGSQHVASTGYLAKHLPTGGVPANRVMADGWNFWGPLYNFTNLPSSQAGADVNVEFDQNSNNLDDAGRRFIIQGTMSEQNTGGYPAEVSNGLYLATNSPNASSFWDVIQAAGFYSQAALDLRYAQTYSPSVTSVTPGSSVQSVTVDNILSLSSGGLFAGGYGYLPTASTAAVTGIQGGTAAGMTLPVSTTVGLATGMYVYDLTTPAAIPANTTIASIAGLNLTLSSTSTVASGDALLFARGQKAVTINGHAYQVAGVKFAGQGSSAGTVWFTAPIPAADAASANRIVPAAHAIWMWEGQTGVPSGDIAFNRAGSVALGCNATSNCTGLNLTGGLAATGPVSASNLSASTNHVWTAGGSGAGIAPFFVTQGLSGAFSGNLLENQLAITGDTVAVTGAATGFGISHTIGGTAMTGSRAALGTTLTLSAATGNTSDSQRTYDGGLFSFFASAPDGGTAALLGSTGGVGYGSSSQVSLVPGATFWTGIVGAEALVGVAPGASVMQKIGVAAMLSAGDAQAGFAGTDTAFRAGVKVGATATWNYGLTLGGQNSPWPMASGSTLIAAVPESSWGTAGRTHQFPAQAAAVGLDFSAVQFSTASLNVPGASISPTGTFSVGNGLLGTTTGGVKLDVPNQIVTAVAVASGGGGGGSGTGDYYAGDVLYGPDGGQYRVTTVSAGAVTGVSIVVPDDVASPPSNPVATTGGSGTGATLTLTWSRNSTLFLNPSAGDVIAGAGSALATAATAGFFHLPFSSGTPTGTPALTSSGPACQWNTVSHTLNCYDGSGWFHLTASSGAG